MSSSKFIIFHTLLALVILAVSLEAGAALPVIHFIHAAGKDSAPIDFHIKAAGMSGGAQVKAGQDYGVRVKIDDIYYVVGIFGPRFASFHAYEPTRDKGRAAVFWRANGQGFDMSHDKVHWKKAAPWQSE